MARKILGAAALSAVICATLQAPPGASANALGASDSGDVLQQLSSLLDGKLQEQRDHYDKVLRDQQAAAQALLTQQRSEYEQQLRELRASLEMLADDLVPVDPTEERRRHLQSLVGDLSDYSGVDIKKDKAGVRMGPNGDVQLLRTSLGELMILANINVTGDLLVNAMNSTIVNVGDFAVDAGQRLDELEDTRQYCKASLEFGAGWAVEYNIANIPFGANDTLVRFDRPITAAPGYGRLVDGVFTAPEDGVYVMMNKIRVRDGSVSDVEIDYMVNDASAESFEMWVSTGDSYGRRSGMSAIVSKLQEGDKLYAKSDLTTSLGVMGVTDVIQIPPNRIAFNVRAAGTNSSTVLPLTSLYEEKASWIVPQEFAGSLSNGVFTAPRAGLFYFICKERVQDSTEGDMEIEWTKNGEETEGGFEMWMHTGDSYGRRAQMSASLMLLDEGDFVYPFSDIGTEGPKNVVLSGFELEPGFPAFKVYNTAAYSYATAAVPFGDGIDAAIDFEISSSGAYEDGVYTVPENGVYFFTTKLRTGDNDNADIEIEWKKNGKDASSINYEMWLHLGDSSNRRSGMSTRLLECVAGDKIYASSDLVLTGSDDIIAQWTFSGFKVR